MNHIHVSFCILAALNLSGTVRVSTTFNRKMRESASCNQHEHGYFQLSYCLLLSLLNGKQKEVLGRQCIRDYAFLPPLFQQVW